MPSLPPRVSQTLSVRRSWFNGSVGSPGSTPDLVKLMLGPDHTVGTARASRARLSATGKLSTNAKKAQRNRAIRIFCLSKRANLDPVRSAAADWPDRPDGCPKPLVSSITERESSFSHKGGRSLGANRTIHRATLVISSKDHCLRQFDALPLGGHFRTCYAGSDFRHAALPSFRTPCQDATTSKKILIIGSGPIVIGQACEFDYSGTQACKALPRKGIRGRARELEPGHDHDRSVDGRSHLHRTPHLGDRRQSY